MNFIGVTITDLNERYKEMTIRSIKSFLKFHDTKLIVYIIGDNKLDIIHKNIEIIHLPEISYTKDNINIYDPVYDKISDILITKLRCLTNHTNFVFFESDVFFIKSIDYIWNALKDGVTGTMVCIDPRLHKTGVNTGLLCIKNYKLNYSLNDIYDYFSKHNLAHPCDQFITKYTDKLYYFDKLSLIVPKYMYTKDISVIDEVYTVHYVGPNKVYTDEYKSTIFLKMLKSKLDYITT